MPTEPVSLDVEGAIAHLRIANGPLNILSVELRRNLLRHVLDLERRDDVRVVTLEGAGEKAFSVGSDIREFPPDMVGGLEKIRFEQFLIGRLEALPQVTIAKLRGHVLGGGGELMLACDFRLAAVTAVFGFPEIKLGAMPAAGGMKRLVRDVGPVRALDLVCRGRTIGAAEAASIGLITECVPPDDLDRAMDVLAHELSALSSEALRYAKKCVRAAERALDIDTVEADAFAELYRGPNLAEGLQAFIQKRPPVFNE
jgi:enoyl-CoA hydratase/carnithine racemase